MSARKILLLGATGMLGQSLQAACASRGLPYTGVARSDTDLALDLSDPDQINRLLALEPHSLVINSSAITDLRECEAHPELTERLHAELPRFCAQLADLWHCPFFQVSTDHYFSSGGRTPHAETEEVELKNLYAKTKYQGERAALDSPRALVVRTNIVGFRGGRFQPSLTEWALGEWESGKSTPGFTDYFVSSIDTATLAHALLDLAAFPRPPTGVLNLASSEVFSKFEFLEALATAFSYPASLVTRSSVQALIGPKRASCLGLDVSKASALLKHPLPGLKTVVQNLRNEALRRGIVQP